MAGVSRTERSASEIPPYILAGQERVREAGLCGELIAGGTEMCIREAGHEPPHGDTGKFWRRGGEDDYVEIRRKGDDDLVIDIEDGSDCAHVVLPQAAESLLQWLDRSRS